jgi:DNA repair protein RadC
MAITDWPINERPRERFIGFGPAALSDAELLAIFFRTGVKGCSAVELARNTLASFGSLTGLLAATEEEFCRTRGLGVAKYVQLQAVMEIAKRSMAEEFKRESVLTSAETTRQYLKLKLRDIPHEVFLMVCLDTQHRVISCEELFRGTINSAIVYPREVIKTALHFNASAVIFAHNHPSGIAEPSQADISLTKRLKQALDFVDINVLDHVVIANSGAVSLAERGLI